MALSFSVFIPLAEPPCAVDFQSSASSLGLPLSIKAYEDEGLEESEPYEISVTGQQRTVEIVVSPANGYAEGARKSLELWGVSPSEMSLPEFPSDGVVLNFRYSFRPPEVAAAFFAAYVLSVSFGGTIFEHEAGEFVDAEYALEAAQRAYRELPPDADRSDP